jgi:hypothetical protein
MTKVDRKIASSDTTSVSFGHGSCELRPRILFEHDHPDGERGDVDVHERHRARERGNAVGDAELEVGRPALPVLYDEGRVLHVDTGHD